MPYSYYLLLDNLFFKSYNIKSDFWWTPWYLNCNWIIRKGNWKGYCRLLFSYHSFDWKTETNLWPLSAFVTSKSSFSYHSVIFQLPLRHVQLLVSRIWVTTQSYLTYHSDLSRLPSSHVWVTFEYGKTTKLCKAFQFSWFKKYIPYFK